MKALILAGGEGSRLKPLLAGLPKCLAPVKGRPFIEHQIEFLRDQGIREFVMCVGFGADKVKETLGKGAGLSVAIEYSVETSPLGTAGAVKNASSFIDGRFLCANGDTLVEFSLGEMERSHAARDSMASILCKKSPDARGRGTLIVGPEAGVLRFEEKPPGGGSALINCGHYLMESSIVDHILPGKAVSLEREIFPSLLSKGIKLSVFVTGGAFADIGTPEDYLRAKEKGWNQ